MIRVGSALALLVFGSALVVFLIPQPCPSAPSGSGFYICIPPNLTQGFLLALVAAALTMLLALAAVYHSLISQRYRYAKIIGAGILTIAICFGVGLLAGMPIGRRTGNGVSVTPLLALAPLAILLSPLLAIVTLRYSVAPPGGQPRSSLLDATPADHVE
jgi:cytochrome bd-type quinol oxidase subunit 2